MEDFEKIIIEDISVIIVNITRATYKEAGMLKKIIYEDIERRFRKIVIDLSACEFVDSTFIGVLVVTLKSISKLGGEIRIIKPASIVHTILAKSGTLDLFNISENVEQAIKNFQALDSKTSSPKSKYSGILN